MNSLKRVKRFGTVEMNEVVDSLIRLAQVKNFIQGIYKDGMKFLDYINKYVQALDWWPKRDCIWTKDELVVLFEFLSMAISQKNITAIKWVLSECQLTLRKPVSIENNDVNMLT